MKNCVKSEHVSSEEDVKWQKFKCYFKNKSKIKKDSFNHLKKKKVNEKIVLNLKIILKCINVNCFVIKFSLFLYLWRKRKKIKNMT